MRFLFLVTISLLLLAVAACGGDDDSGSDASATPDESSGAPASGDVTPTNVDSPTPAPTPSPTPEPTPSPTRRPVTADRYARFVGGDVTGFLAATFGAEVPVPVACPWDDSQGIIDCSSEGFGTIALDTFPDGNVIECRALTLENEMLAVSCSTDAPAGWVYRLEEEPA